MNDSKEANKESAFEALEKARSFYKQGNLDRAWKLILKSIQLYPTEEGKKLFQQIKSKLEESKSQSETKNHRAGKDEEEESKSETKSNNNNESSSEPSPSQKQSVDKVLKAKNYYEILGVDKNASTEEITKRYRKLALQMHPDKNKCSGSEEAFKKVSQAFSCLKDPEKRKQYDLRGDEESSGSGPYRRRTNAYEFETEISPEELFSAFFGVPLRQNSFTRAHATNNFFSDAQNRRRANPNVFFHTTRRTYRTENDDENVRISWTFPLLLIMLLMFLLPSSQVESPYKLSSISPYVEKRVTTRYRINYFVKSDFQSTYSREAIQEIENRVEKEWTSMKQTECKYEQSQRQTLLTKARWYGLGTENGKKLEETARNLKLHSCDLLKEKGIPNTY